MTSPRFSVIIPVYNRPQELEELLSSLAEQTYTNFEVIVVEDGSSERSDAVAEKYSERLNIQYFYKVNSGPGPSRNFGYSHARGEYLVVFDSDCIIPAQYLEVVEKSILINHWDAWGGPDRAHQNFTALQRAMGYTMSSFFTTGGIRGGKKHIGRFQPRSFNMGISKKVFEVTQGFRFDRFAEDIEFSIRMRNFNFKVGLITEAFVYHKRRTNFAQFYQQVYNFGRGRALVGNAYPAEIKLTHWFPTLFVLSVCSLFFLAFLFVPFFLAGLAGFAMYMTAIFLHSLVVNQNLAVAVLSVPSAWLQLWGYGIGFLKEYIRLRRRSA
jgi:glycosyltransferase involved in cell wall biosynthesis